jgi:hypothetical protein
LLILDDIHICLLYDMLYALALALQAMPGEP